MQAQTQHCAYGNVKDYESFGHRSSVSRKVLSKQAYLLLIFSLLESSQHWNSVILQPPFLEPPPATSGTRAPVFSLLSSCSALVNPGVRKEPSDEEVSHPVMLSMGE